MSKSFSFNLTSLFLCLCLPFNEDGHHTKCDFWENKTHHADSWLMVMNAWQQPNNRMKWGEVNRKSKLKKHHLSTFVIHLWLLVLYCFSLLFVSFLLWLTGSSILTCLLYVLPAETIFLFLHSICFKCTHLPLCVFGALSLLLLTLRPDGGKVWVLMPAGWECEISENWIKKRRWNKKKAGKRAITTI